jgi:hypothetical protein
MEHQLKLDAVGYGQWICTRHERIFVNRHGFEQLGNIVETQVLSGLREIS